MFQESNMKTILNVVGILLILGGGVWFLQGIGILPGSFMSNDPQWAINGAISIMIGVGLIAWARRK